MAAAEALAAQVGFTTRAARLLQGTAPAAVAAGGARPRPRAGMAVAATRMPRWAVAAAAVVAGVGGGERRKGEDGKFFFL